MGPNGQAQYRAADVAGRLPDPPAPLRAQLRRAAASASRAARRPPTRRTATCATPRTSRPDSALARIGDVFSDEKNPGASSRSTSAASCAQPSTPTTRRWSAGPTCSDAETAVVWDAHLGGWPVTLARHRVAAVAAPRRAPGRRARGVELGHAVPALGQEGRARDQRRQRPPARRRAGQPRRLRRLAGVDARVAARVRGRDRARGGQLRRPDRLLRGLPLPRRRLRRVLPATQPRARDGGAGGRARVGHRRRARRGRRVRPRGRAGGPPRRPDRRARLAHRGGGGLPSASSCAPSVPSATTRCWPRSAGSSRPSSTPSTASSAPCA